MNADNYNLRKDVVSANSGMKANSKYVGVVGLDTEGLTTAAILAEIGHSVKMIGRSNAQIRSARAGLFTTDEYALECALIRGKSAKRLNFTSDLIAQTLNSEVLFLTKHLVIERGSEEVLDEGVIHQLARALRKRSSFLPIVIVSSGHDFLEIDPLIEMLKSLSGKTYGEDFGVALLSVPMFVGSAYEDFWSVSEIDLGVSDTKTEAILKEVFIPIMERISISSIAEVQLLQKGSALWQMMRVSFLSEYCRLANSIDQEHAFSGNVASKIFDRYCSDGVSRINSMVAGCSTSKSRAEKLSDIVSTGNGNFPFLRAVVSSSHSQILEALAFLEGLDVRRIGFLGLRDRAGDRSLSSSPYLALMMMLKDAGKITGYCDNGLGEHHFNNLNANLSPVPGLIDEGIKGFLETCRFNRANEVTETHDVILLCSNRPSYLSAAKKMAKSKPIIDLCGGLLSENTHNITTMPFN